ncbi:scavenger receptor class A member 5-like, partial [Anneissia japonica]|uniref:scavenger receptor class A member 5-like n=1 Tax=Anneissia japonica TaxID=1529436 RepID=UPI00142591EE
SIRLSSGSVSWEGRLEVWWYKTGCWLFCEDRWEWGTVCDDMFGMNDANVACRSLGYVGAASYRTWGGGGGPIWIDDLQCGGGESQIWHCNSRRWDNSNCGHGEDVGVVC